MRTRTYLLAALLACSSIAAAAADKVVYTMPTDGLGAITDSGDLTCPGSLRDCRDATWFGPMGAGAHEEQFSIDIDPSIFFQSLTMVVSFNDIPTAMWVNGVPSTFDYNLTVTDTATGQQVFSSHDTSLTRGSVVWQPRDFVSQNLLFDLTWTGNPGQYLVPSGDPGCSGDACFTVVTDDTASTTMHLNTIAAVPEPNTALLLLLGLLGLGLYAYRGKLTLMRSMMRPVESLPVDRLTPV